MIRILLLLTLFWAMPVGATPEAEIRKVLGDQVAAWNRADVPGFMEGYAKAPTTTFVSSKITKGYVQVLNNYLTRYDSRDKMGALSFSDLEVNLLSPEYASVIGRWILTRYSGENDGGFFTLLFQKTPEGWRIILDHTS